MYLFACSLYCIFLFRFAQFLGRKPSQGVGLAISTNASPRNTAYLRKFCLQVLLNVSQEATRVKNIFNFLLHSQ